MIEYPIAEHYDVPNDPLAYMADNRRLYKPGDEMRQYVDGYIHAMYKEQPLHEYFSEISRLVYLHDVTIEEVSQDKSGVLINPGFYAGTLIAMDAGLYTLPSDEMTTAVATRNPLDSPRSNQHQTNETRLAEEYALIEKYAADFGIDILRSWSKSASAEVMSTSHAYCRGKFIRVADRKNVINGIVFGLGTIDELKATVSVSSSEEISVEDT